MTHVAEEQTTASSQYQSTNTLSNSKQNLTETLHAHGLQLKEDDEYYVQWASENPDHPRNWSQWITAYNVAIIVALEAFTAAMTTVGTSASSEATLEYGVSQQVGYFAFTTVTLIGEALGAVIFPPISESFGRKKVYIVATVGSTIFTGITAAPSLGAVIVGRFMMGVVGAISATVSPGSIEDIFDTEGRVWAVYAWATASNAGLTTGPIVAAYVVVYAGWRWIFYIGTVMSAVFVCLSLCIRESRPALLLERKLAQVQKEPGYSHLKVDNPDNFQTLREYAREALFRPLNLLFTEPIVIVCSTLSATAFGLIYGLTEGLNVVYTDFGFTDQAASLAFIPITIGIFLSIIPRIYDRRRILRLRRNNLSISPEEKIYSFGIAVPALAVALWWFAWTIPRKVAVPWIVSMIGLVPVGYAVNDIDIALIGYIADSYTTYAASAFAALALTRTLISCAFAQFTEIMFIGLGSNIAVSILAAVATVFCFAPILFLKYGRKLREKSPFACHSLVTSETEAIETTINQDGLEDPLIT